MTARTDLVEARMVIAPAVFAPVRAAVAALVTFLLISIPTDILPTPLFGREVPVRWWEYLPGPRRDGAAHRRVVRDPRAIGVGAGSTVRVGVGGRWRRAR